MAPADLQVGLDFSERDGDDAPRVMLSVDGEHHDVVVLLLPEEARALVEQLLARLDVLTAASVRVPGV